VHRDDKHPTHKMPKMNFEPISLVDAWKKYIEATYIAEELKAESLPFGVDAASLEAFFFFFFSSFFFFLFSCI